MMNVRKNAKYAVACLSSMGLRITPENRMAVHNSNRFLLQATSAETNVLNVTSALGPTCVLAASSLNDYAEPADEKQVWDVYAGNARVQR